MSTKKSIGNRVKVLFFILIAVFLFMVGVFNVFAEASVVATLEIPDQVVSVGGNRWQKEFLSAPSVHVMEDGTASGVVIIGVNSYQIESGEIGCKFRGGCLKLSGPNIEATVKPKDPGHVEVNFSMILTDTISGLPTNVLPEGLITFLPNTSF